MKTLKNVHNRYLFPRSFQSRNSNREATLLKITFLISRLFLFQKLTSYSKRKCYPESNGIGFYLYGLQLKASLLWQKLYMQWPNILILQLIVLKWCLLVFLKSDRISDILLLLLEGYKICFDKYVVWMSFWSNQKKKKKA